MTALDATTLLRRESRSLVQRLRLWTPARYAALASGSAGSRADLVHHLAQALADAAAACEDVPARPLPRLPSDLALADQLAVTSDDLVRAGPPVAVAVAATAHLLAHRYDLLEEDVPGGLAASLGLDDVLAAGRAACDLSS
jgi:hypothetical protein